MEKKINKYYHPDISEFHLGFEFEIVDNQINEWKKVTLGINDMTKFFFTAHEKKFKGDGIRVKFIDKEDIESLGFKQSETDPYWYDYKNDRYWLYKEDENDWRWIIEDDQSEISFAGTIKNKSELKKLMKQLNIN